MKDLSSKGIYKAAIQHLSRQDYTISEMAAKLKKKTNNDDLINETIEHLLLKGYIKADYDFSVQLTESAFRKNIGKVAIMHKLISKGVSERNADIAIESVMIEQDIDLFELASYRLAASFLDFRSTTKERVCLQLAAKGFSVEEITYAIDRHPKKDTLLSQLEIKAARSCISDEIVKLYKKGKGPNLIRRELSARLINVRSFDDVVSKLEDEGVVDFTASAKAALLGKNYNMSDDFDKKKASYHLFSKGFCSDVISSIIPVN